jgi:hypothetical protein
MKNINNMNIPSFEIGLFSFYFDMFNGATPLIDYTKE